MYLLQSKTGAIYVDHPTCPVLLLSDAHLLLPLPSPNSYTSLPLFQSDTQASRQPLTEKTNNVLPSALKLCSDVLMEVCGGTRISVIKVYV